MFFVVSIIDRLCVCMCVCASGRVRSLGFDVCIRATVRCC